MTKDYLKFIKELRIKKGLAQAEIAEKIGISRSSYISFEQGKTELNMTEAAKLADILGVSLEEMKSGLKPNYNKYKQMILAYLRADQGADGKVPKTKLAKLLYLADFAWFYKHLESMSGMAYRRIKYGPVPDNYFRAVEELYEEGSIQVVCSTNKEAFLISLARPGERNNLSELSTEEKNLIKDISAKWKDKRTQEIIKFTHDQLPYQICEDNEIIPYGLITQEDPDHVY